MTWAPHVTVAALIQDAGRFLLVEEETEEGIRYNQPAGHLERGERLIDAVIRETLEETAHEFVPEYFLGVYHWCHPSKGITYLRFLYGGHSKGLVLGRSLDTGIIAAHWLTYDEIMHKKSMHRSPMVARCIEDWSQGRRFPIDMVRDYDGFA